MATQLGGGMPPTDIEPSELWLRLCADERAYEIVDFPRKDRTTGLPMGQIAIRVLTHGEIIASKADATRYGRACIREKFEANEYLEGHKQIFEDACASEMIYRFVRRANDQTLPVFPTVAAVRERLTRDECDVLINQYAAIQHRLGPIVDLMDDDTADAWIKRLQEGGAAAPLAFLSSGQKDDLLMRSVSRLQSLQEVNSSVGSPPGETTLNENA